MYKALVIPDLQVKHGVSQKHLSWAAKLANRESPDVIIQLGDWFDMESLSVYDRGRKRAEGARYQKDINAGNRSIQTFESALKKYKGEKHVLIGNHEERIKRHVEEFPALEGKLSYEDFHFKKNNWRVHDFLQPYWFNGVSFSHFFCRTAKGTVTAGSSRNGAGSAAIQLKANMHSCIAGHKQGFDYYEHPIGSTIRQSIIAGSFYRHDEHYLGPQGNDYWRGVLVLNFRNNRDAYFDLERWSMWRLKEVYGK